MDQAPLYTRSISDQDALQSVPTEICSGCLLSAFILWAQKSKMRSVLLLQSGTVFTRLVQPAYIAVRDEFRRRIGNAAVQSLGGFDTCYSVPIVAPTITFMFTGMNVTLPPDNILLHSTVGTITCLAMAAAPDNVNSVLNVIANMQQQNHRILFDVPNSRLGVSREPCT